MQRSRESAVAGGGAAAGRGRPGPDSRTARTGQPAAGGRGGQSTGANGHTRGAPESAVDRTLLREKQSTGRGKLAPSPEPRRRRARGVTARGLTWDMHRSAAEVRLTAGTTAAAAGAVLGRAGRRRLGVTRRGFGSCTGGRGARPTGPRANGVLPQLGAPVGS